MCSGVKKTRVLHIISGDLWAGAESQAYTLLKYLQPHMDLHVVIMNDGELANRLRAINVSITLLPETKLSSFIILKSLSALIRKLQPAIIHTHRQKENILGSIANFIAFPLPAKRPKSLRTSHGAPEFNPVGRQKLQVWLDHFVGKYLQQAVIAVSDDLAKKLASIFPAGHIHVIHNGVDCAALNAAVQVADFKSAHQIHKHIGIVGRLEPVKRIDIFIEMAAILLKAQTAPVLFHIIGDGRLRPQMEALAESLGITQSVCFHGHRNDMATCIGSLDGILMCSDHEGTPMVALESLTLGTVVIAHDVGGLHELLADQPAFLVQEHTALGYAKKVSEYLQGHLQTPYLHERYRADVNARAVIALYEKLVN